MIGDRVGHTSGHFLPNGLWGGNNTKQTSRGISDMQVAPARFISPNQTKPTPDPRFAHLPPPPPPPPVAAEQRAPVQGALFDVGQVAPKLVEQTSEKKPAPPVQLRLWNEPEWVHASQVRGPANPDAVFPNSNCAPTSTVMALRMIGKDVPGFAGGRVQDAIDAVRMLATGKNDHSVGVYPQALVPVLEKAGTRPRVTKSFDDVIDAAKKGIPVLISRNSGERESYDGMNFPPTLNYGYLGHMVVVSRFDKPTGRFTVSDPGKHHAVYVTEDDLQKFALGRPADKNGTRKFSKDEMCYEAVIVDDKSVDVMIPMRR